METELVEVALVLPESGPSGIFGPSCLASAELAVAELNSRGGLLGQEIICHVVDGGDTPARVAIELQKLREVRPIEAVIGWHTSTVRKRIARDLAGEIPYVYTAVYEGGENAPGVYLTGEVPDTQILPAMKWMAEEINAQNWYVVGSDYIWPRRTLASISAAVNSSGFRRTAPINLAEAQFVPLGMRNYDAILDRIEGLGVDSVLLLLLGQDAVAFNRAFTKRGYDRDVLRMSPLMDENMLLASGHTRPQSLYSVSGFFERLPTAASMEFSSRYAGMFGPSSPPMASPGESCYEGVSLLAHLAARSGSLRVESLSEVAHSGLSYESPRGNVRIQGHHLLQDTYLACADGFDYDVVAQVGA